MPCTVKVYPKTGVKLARVMDLVDFTLAELRALLPSDWTLYRPAGCLETNKAKLSKRHLVHIILGHPATENKYYHSHRKANKSALSVFRAGDGSISSRQSGSHGSVSPAARSNAVVARLKATRRDIKRRIAEQKTVAKALHRDIKAKRTEAAKAATDKKKRRLVVDIAKAEADRLLVKNTIRTLKTEKQKTTTAIRARSRARPGARRSGSRSGSRSR